MKTWQYALAIALLFVLVALQALPILTPDRTYPSWEYKIVGIPDEKFDEEMNAWGEARWEMVFARRALAGEGRDRSGLYEVIFKRPK